MSNLSWEDAWPLGLIHSGLPIEISTRHEGLFDQPLDSLIAARWRTLFIRRHLGSGDELRVKHCCRGQQDILAMQESANGSARSLVSGSPT